MAAANFMRLVNVPSVSKHHQEKTPSLDTDIVFDRVTFAYDARPTAPVLRDMSFRIRKGETVAIVGATGSGKSTIAALVTFTIVVLAAPRGGNGGGECKPVAQSCAVNSECCSDLCVVGVSNPFHCQPLITDSLALPSSAYKYSSLHKLHFIRLKQSRGS